MTSSTPPDSEDLSHHPQDFSLVLGGPLYQLMRRTHIAGGAADLVRRRMVVLSLIAWLPLLVLAVLGGEALHGKADVPFLLDVDVHVRFLVVLPLLVLAELVVHQRMRSVVRQFRERDLIPEDCIGRFENAIRAAVRLRNSVPVEVLLIALVYFVSVPMLWRNYAALTTATWYSVPTPTGPTLTLGGLWYGYLSMPLFQFLVLRWYFRIFIWARFLWHVSRIDLRLMATHPDRVGGLGFLTSTAHAFIPLAAAHGAMTAGLIANRIFHLGAGLLDFKAEIAIGVAFVLILVFCPLLVFAPGLAAAKRNGLREYGILAGRYTHAFHARWLRSRAPADDALLGSGDIQSLADLGNAFEVVRSMRVVPIGRDAVLQLAAAVVLPILPLTLTLMSLEDLLKQAFGILF